MKKILIYNSGNNDTTFFLNFDPIELTKKSVNLKEAEEILKSFTHTEESLKTNNPKKKQKKLKIIKKK